MLDFLFALRLVVFFAALLDFFFTLRFAFVLVAVAADFMLAFERDTPAFDFEIF